MKEQLEQYLIAAVEKAADVATWAEGELPSLVEEVLRWYAVYYSANAIIGAALVYLSVKGYMWFNKKYSEARDVFSPPIEVPMTFLVAGGLVSFLFSAAHALNAVKVMVAPRLFLLEYASKLVSG